MNNLAIIPARGGSKRIPHKNIQPFLGKPIIAYSIEAALQSGLFQEVMVSTDCPETARIAQSYGATVPFMRSDEAANDFAPLSDVLVEVVEAYARQQRHFEKLCCLLPTAPLTSADTIRRAYDLLEEGHFNSVCPVVPFSYPILRSLNMDDDGLLTMNWPEHRLTRSQDLKPAYHDSGTLYWIRTYSLMHDKKLFSDYGSALVMDEMQVQDIDTPSDWALAELKYRLLYPLEK